MKKITLSLFALAALSTASLAAGNRSWDLRDLETFNAYSSSGATLSTKGTAEMPSAALAIPGIQQNDGVLTAYERQRMNADLVEHNSR